MKKLTLGAIALAASTVIGSTASHADLVGQLWLNEPAVATNLALFPTSLNSGIDATFTSTAFNYTGSFIGTIGAFLGGDAASIVSNNPAFTAAQIAAAPLGDTVFRFTGNAIAPAGTVGGTSVPAGTLGILHDDGVVVSSGINTIGGNIINSPVGTPAIFSTGALASAMPVTVLYGECCGGPATLISNIDNAVPAPEPASLAILGVALVGFGVMRRRYRKTS